MKKAIAISIFLMASAIGYAAPTVSNETAKQRYPWGLVDITCMVSGIDGTHAKYGFELEAVMPESGNTNKVSHFWVVQNGTNSTDRSVHTNGNYRLLWDARSDLGQVYYSNMVLRVTVIDLHDKIQLWEGGPYWATTNIGADEPYEYGCYFWWGDTIGYKRENNAWVASDGSSSDYSFESNVPTRNKDIAMLKSEGWITEDGVLVPEYDAAHVHWGGSWRMPTKQELSDLNSKCNWKSTTMNGVSGYQVSGKDDYTSASIFLPCARYAHGRSLITSGSDGCYWSSVPNSANDYSWYLSFDSDYIGTVRNGGRYFGRPVRPVQEFAGSAGDTAPFLLDTVPFLLDTAQSAVDSLPVSWDAAWIGGDANAMVVITDNGIEVTRTTGVGEFAYTLSGIGRHNLTYTTYIDGVAKDEVYTATVFKDWKYEVVDGGAVITETTQTSGEVTIPSEIDGYPVTGVASGTFENCSGLTTVFIPQGYTGGTDVFPSSTMVIRPRQLVTFDATGGTVSPASNIVEYGASYGFLPEPSRTGYTFAGWKWNGQAIYAETMVTALDNHTLFAEWITNKYSVVFDANGGNGGVTTELDYASEIVVPEVTRAGYAFAGWQPIPLDMVPASNVTFYAQWTACEYLVSFDASGGSLVNSQSQKTVIYDDAYGEMPEATRVGYTFAGWELYGQKVLPDTMVSTASNHTLTACWSANRYVVELNPNGGSLDPDDSTVEVVFDSEYGELPCPERIGYSFTGWTASLIDADVIEPDSLATTNQILYALWEANPYQVVYEANNGSGETDRADAVYDEDVEIAANPFVWMGHVFVGWSTSADGEAVYEPGQIVRNLTSERDGEVTLYAIWEPLVVATPVITPGDGASFVGDTCLVTISCATDGADIYFSTRGTPPRIRESYRYSGAFEITDTTCVMAIALKENVTSEVAVVTISRRELTIPEAAGAMELTFETGGDVDWVPMADVSAASGYSVRSGAIGCASYGTSNVTWLATEVGGAGTFSFRWKVDCEHDYTGMYLWDRLVVFTNDVEAAKIDGSQDWADVSLQFADSGRHSIRWLFLKDDEDDDGASFEDCAWVSGVKWTPAIVVADTEYDIGEMPESVAVQPGVTLSIKVESEPTESDIAALAERVTVSPKSSEQNAEYFKVVGNYDSAKESIALKVVIDEEAIGLAVTSQEVLDAVVDQAFSAGEVLLVSAKPGLYYGIVVVDDLSKMEAASVDVVFVKAGENGVRLTIPKPQSPSAFFKIVVSDVGNE